MITSFVLKVASRCNLNCSYCYMYNLGDKTYLKQPKFMSIDTIKAFAAKLNEYCLENNLNNIQIVFHGGEPLLISKDFYRESIKIFKEILPDNYFDFVIQTNGVGLDDEWYQLFNELNIRVGVSIDGPKEYHDKYRVFHNGKGSYEEVKEAIILGQNYGLNGILSVINIKIPPQELYDEAKALKVKGLSILLPDGHFDQLPEGMEKDLVNTKNYTPYADWLIELFKIWKSDNDRMSVRFFKTLIDLIVGEDEGDQVLGKNINGVAVLETNGNLEVADFIRACYEGITRNDINIHTHAIGDVFKDRLFDVYMNAHSMVSQKCLNCSVYDFCGGGFLGNRYSNDRGFDNPTIYCHDMIKVITYIQNDIIDDIPQETQKEMELLKVSYDDIVHELEFNNEEIMIKSEVKEKLMHYRLA